MKKATQPIKSTEISPARWVFGGLAAITLYFQTNLNDPFNAPKSWILFIVAAWLIGYIVSFRNIIFSNKDIKKLFYLILMFIIFCFIATLSTDFKYVAIFGDTQRRNGFIAYTSLAIMMLGTSVFVRFFNVKTLYTTAFIVATILSTYALMQINGKDFVKWNNPYNSIIGTLGNPNFAAAVMAIVGVLLFSLIFISKFKIYFRVISGLVTASLLGLIYQSDARQGLLSYFLGTSLFLILWLLGERKKIGSAAAGSGIVVFIFALLGMLQIGPLEKFLYKPSVSVRGYYWRAGLEMLKHHPLVGVGMDRYGAYFKQYREVGYPLSYGFDITSSNAHNTFIQLFATGGIFLGLSYLLLNAYIFRQAIRGIKRLTGNNRLLLAGIFAAWISFHAQSLVSIDNIGISIWGWVLGGAIIGLSVSSNNSTESDRILFLRKQSDINIMRVVVSSSMAGLIFILVVFLYRGETNTFNAKASFDLQDQTTRSLFKNIEFRAINSKLNDPSYSLNCAAYLVKAGFVNEGILVIENIHAADPRNLDAINFLAITYENFSSIPKAIEYREKMAKLDPWNAVNYLALGKAYKAQGDLVKSKAMLDKILSFSTGDIGGPIAAQAKTELAS